MSKPLSSFLSMLISLMTLTNLFLERSTRASAGSASSTVALNIEMMFCYGKTW